MGKRINTIVWGSFIIASSLLLSCEETKQRPSVSVYHWKTDFSIAKKETALLNKLNSKRIFLRFFDISYNTDEQKPLPIATLQLSKTDSIPSQEIVPVVYITNEVFRRTTDSAAIRRLAKATMDKIGRLKNKYFKNGQAIKEIQMDCDWTESTKIAYFQFLQELKKQETFIKLGKEIHVDATLEISATVRLHQIKYREKTGVPPIDKAILMCYNVGELKNVNESNSILNIETAASYLGRLNEYPLPFDIALPYYGWGALYRDGTFAGILNELTETKRIENFEKTAKEGVFKATSDTYINKTFVYKNDILRWETVTPENLKALMVLIRDATTRKYSLILYHLNSTELENQDIDALLEILY